MLNKLLRKSSSCRLCFYSTSQPGRSTHITYEEAKEKVKTANRFGINGLKSGVDIRKLWPTVEEIQEFKALRMHRTTQEAARIAEEKKREEVERRIKREKDIDEKLNSYS